MAEGPDPASRSSQDKSSPQEEQEPVVVEPDVTCGHCKRELNNPYLLCCLHSVCRECLPNMVVENGRLKCPKCGDTSTHCNDRKVLESECRVDSLRCVPVPNGPFSYTCQSGLRNEGIQQLLLETMEELFGPSITRSTPLLQLLDIANKSQNVEFCQKVLHFVSSIVEIHVSRHGNLIWLMSITTSVHWGGVSDSIVT